MRFLLLALIVISGCTPGIDPGPCRSEDCLRETYGLRLIRKIRVVGDSTLITNDAEAEFRPADEEYPFDNLGVDAGKVKVNAGELRKIVANNAGVMRVMYGLNIMGDSLIAPPGEMNRWSIGGSLEVAPFTATMVTPADLLAILTPANGDTIRTDSLLTIRWPLPNLPGASDSTDIEIEIREEGTPWVRFNYQGLDDGEVSLPIAALRASGISTERGLVITLRRTISQRGITASAHLYGLYFMEEVEGRMFISE